MTEDAKIALGKLTDALTGKTRGINQYAEVMNLDVIAVAESIPDDKRTRGVKALLKGAKGASQKNAEGDDVAVPVHQMVDDLFVLVQAAGA